MIIPILDFVNRLLFSIGTCLLLLSLSASAQSLLQEGVREFEELRLRQLEMVQAEAQIEAFTSDGCSGNLSQGWEFLADSMPGFVDQFGQRPPWEHCCIDHDRSYWRGEVVDGFEQRAQADEMLRQCVIANGDELAPRLAVKFELTEAQVREGFLLVADVMHRAVRLGGQPCSLLPWRWGYGWPNCAFALPAEIPLQYSDIKADEQVVFFNTAAWRVAKTGYWQLPIHGWIYELHQSDLRAGAFASLLASQFQLELNAAAAPYFDRRTNLLIADNERNKRLVIRLGGRDHELPLSTENGRVSTLLKLPEAQVNAIANHDSIDYFAVTGRSERRRFEGRIRLLAATGVSVISDIDDTIKLTGVTDRRSLLENTFFKPFAAVPGMAELYRRLAARDVSLHFVSSSPWQLYQPLIEFMRDAGYPEGTLDLKSVRFRDQTLIELFKKGTATKPAQIEPWLQRYPGRRFILIGDSGEQDPEVYGGIWRRYPEQVISILIRNVDGSSAGDERYRQAFAGLATNRWQLFDDPGEISLDALFDLP